MNKTENQKPEQSRPMPLMFFERPTELKNINSNLDQTHRVLSAIMAEWLKVTDHGELSIQIIRDKFITTNYLGSRSPAVDRIMYAVMRERVKTSPLFNEINIDNLIAMTIKKPDITDLVTAVNGLSDYFTGPGMAYNDIVYWQCFQIRDHAVVRVESEIEALKSAYRFVARTPEEHTRLQLVLRIIEAMNPIIENYHMPIEKMAVFGLIATDGERLYPDPIFVIDNRIYDAIVQPRFESTTTTAPTIGDIRSHVPLSAGYGPGDVIAQIAQKRNKQTN